MDLNLRTLDQEPAFLADAVKLWAEGDVSGILCYMSNTRNLAFVMDNIGPLQDAGKYEEALYHAYTATRTNNFHYGFYEIRFLFCMADPDRLRHLGSPVPNKDTFILYRGVSGNGRARRVQGMSWTESPNIASWFAQRFCNLGDPAVFRVTVPRDQILFCCDERNEKEYVLRLPLPVKPKRVLPMPEAKIERKKEALP